MNDYRKIRREDTGRLQPKHTALLHADSRLVLMQFLASGDRARAVVITHHAPSLRSLPEHKHAEPISAREYAIGSTRIVNNAFGYPNSEGVEERGFRGDMVINV